MRQITKNGHSLIVDDNFQDAFWKYFESGGWEPYTFNIFDTFLSPEDSYLDLGAWIGPTVLYAADLCKHCYAIEPDKIAYDALLRNIGLSQKNNITPFNCAIFNYDGTLQLGNDLDLGNSVTRPGQSQNLFDVECFKLSTFVSRHGIDNLKFIKIDVEGCEEFIFEDFDFFASVKPVVYLSLHEFWFTDKAAGMEKIKTIGKLYKNSYDIHLNKINLDSLYDGVVFTD